MKFKAIDANKVQWSAEGNMMPSILHDIADFITRYHHPLIVSIEGKQEGIKHTVVVTFEEQAY